jgi:hypothetical protein
MTFEDHSPEEGQRHSEKKTFLSNIFRYFFDKIFGPLFVVLISGVIIFYYQENSKHEQKIQDEAIASAKVSTEILIKQRGILMETIVEYMQLLAEIKDKGIANADDQKNFRILRKKVDVALNTLYPMIVTLYPKDINIKNYSDAANNFRNSTLRPSKDLSQRRSKEYIEGISWGLFNNYLSFMKEIDGVTRKIIKDEIEKAGKELNRDTEAKKDNSKLLHIF